MPLDAGQKTSQKVPKNYEETRVFVIIVEKWFVLFVNSQEF